LLNLSEHTVKNYLSRIFDKLGISNRVELVLYAVANPSKIPLASDWPEQTRAASAGAAKLPGVRPECVREKGRSSAQKRVGQA